MIAYYIGYVLVVVFLTWYWRRYAEDSRARHSDEGRVYGFVHEETALLEDATILSLPMSVDAEMEQSYAFNEVISTDRGCTFKTQLL
jgi:hypothetical protein